MDFDEYQKLASETDQFPDRHSLDISRSEAIQIPLFGLIGEVGSLVTSFKKKIRDQSAYQDFMPQAKEEIGDVLWYLSNIAAKMGFSLNEIAEENLEKTSKVWSPEALGEFYCLYDDSFPEGERLPREICARFDETSEDDTKYVTVYSRGKQVGDELTDNAYADDGYRYHDVFHLAYAAILGWSPVLRKLYKCKRKSNKLIDEVEDGARAIITEEFISLYVYNYAKKHNFLDGVSEIDMEVIRTIRSLVSDLEVRNRTAYEWRSAIFLGFEIYRDLKKRGGGSVEMDMLKRSLRIVGE